MYISLNWIKEHVNLEGIDEDELIKRFLLSTAEIEEVIHKGQDVQGVIFAKITQCRSPP